ncbi:hypothetical protein N0V88_007691 [Collariella sp. IMI 366227]|nr:hypothetical protein N0V88_007691 [Collariella sp. IMI 366227]
MSLTSPSPIPETDSSSRPSSCSTFIAVGTDQTPEEDLYAAAQAMREAMKAAIRSRTASPAMTRKNSVASPRSVSVSVHDAPQSSGGSSGSSSDGSDADEEPSTAGHDPSPEGEDGQAPPPALAFAEDMSRYPPSMTSSVRDHVFEGGLRYHAYRAGRYAFPNDEVEQNRDDMKHTMTLMLCHGAYFYAPVEDILEDGGDVLDLGTGIWVMELGDKYPNTTFTGIDLSPIQPIFVPENVHFFVDDFEEEWIDSKDKYDFIHIRHTLHSVQDPQALVQQAYHHLKPGGYFEAQELIFTPFSDDDTLTPDTPFALRDYINYMSAGLRALGSDVYAITSLPHTLSAAGFEDVTTTTHKAPLGLWPQDNRLRICGLFMRTAIMDGLRGLSRRPLMALGWTMLQIEMFLVEHQARLLEV